MKNLIIRISHNKIRLVALFLIMLGASGIVYGSVSYQEQPRPPKQTIEVKVTPDPSSNKPTTKAIASYTVAPDLPKYISIPSINVTNARVIRLGYLANGQITTPDNIYDTGWYENSSKPGQKGAMFIFGHVSSWTANGVFYNLKNLMPGDKVIVTRGDNVSFTYVVVKTKIYPYNEVDMQQVLSPINFNKPGLNLMTCTGQVIKGTSEFNERLVVFTSLVT